MTASVQTHTHTHTPTLYSDCTPLHWRPMALTQLDYKTRGLPPSRGAAGARPHCPIKPCYGTLMGTPRLSYETKAARPFPSRACVCVCGGCVRVCVAVPERRAAGSRSATSPSWRPCGRSEPPASPASPGESARCAAPAPARAPPSPDAPRPESQSVC